MKGLMQYVHGDTALHRMNPLTKLFFAVMLCASCFASHSLLFLAGMIGLSLLVALWGGVLKQALRTLVALCKFCSVLWLLQVFFVGQGRALVSLPFGLAITDEGLRFSTLICLRLIGATLPLTIVLMLTQMSHLTRALVDQLHVPYRYAFALTTALRFIPVLSAEMAGVMEAQTARGVEFDGNLIRKIRLLLPLCAPLLISAVRRIEDSAVSAELRGFHLRGRGAGGSSMGFTAVDVAMLAVCALLPVAGALL